MPVYGGPNTNESGLILAIDSRNPKSYVSGSTTTTNMGDNKVSFSLINGTSYNGESWEFDSLDDTIELTPFLTTLQSLSQATIEVWARPDFVANFGEFSKPVFTIGGTTNQSTISFGFQGNSSHEGKLMSYATNANPTGNIRWVLRTQTSVIQTGEWMHLVLQHNGTQAKHFINGEEMTSVFSSDVQRNYWFDNTTGLSDNSYMGAQNTNNNGIFRVWDGGIANLKIYSSVLTPAEIKQNYEDMKYRFR